MNEYEFKNEYEFTCEDYELVNGTFMFTDVVSSTNMARNHGDVLMTRALCEHYNRMYEIINKFNGTIVKTVGDEFVVFFEDKFGGLLNSLKCGITIRTNLLKFPIVIGGNDSIKIRMGMAHGPARKIKMISQKVVSQPPKVSNIQKFIKSRQVKTRALKPMTDSDMFIESFHLDDYLGNIVNLASRMESQVSRDFGNSIAFALNDDETGKIIESVDDIPESEMKLFQEKLADFTRKQGFEMIFSVVQFDEMACQPWYLWGEKYCASKLKKDGIKKMVIFTIDFKRLIRLN